MVEELNSSSGLNTGANNFSSVNNNIPTPEPTPVVSPVTPEPIAQNVINRQPYYRKSGSWIKVLIISLILFLILIAFYQLLITKKTPFRKLNSYITIARDVKILKDNAMVLEKNFRLTVKTNKVADKMVIFYGTDPKKLKKEEGKVITVNQNGDKIWEFSTEKLKKGVYSYKFFVKNSKSGKFGFKKGTFEIK